MQHATGRLQRYTLPFQHGQYSILSAICFGGEALLEIPRWQDLDNFGFQWGSGVCAGNVHLKTVLCFVVHSKAASGWKWAARLLSSWPLC